MISYLALTPDLTTRRIVDQLDPARRNVVEFRHRSWWNEEVYDAFRESGTIFCSCSGPRLPDELAKTADEIYLRFHGTTRWYRHDYSTSELAAWAEKIRPAAPGASGLISITTAAATPSKMRGNFASYSSSLCREINLWLRRGRLRGLQK